MDLNKLKGQLQTEVDTAFLYDSIAEIQADENLNRVLRGLSDIEKDMQHMLDKVRTIQSEYKMPAPSSSKFQLKLGKLFGYGSIISNLSSIENNLLSIR
jgi:peptidoglycan hydrolase CwlO-like protein